MAIIRKRRKTILKAQVNWFENQDDVVQVITEELRKRFAKDKMVNSLHASPLSDITEADNELLLK